MSKFVIDTKRCWSISALIVAAETSAPKLPTSFLGGVRVAEGSWGVMHKKKLAIPR